MSEQTVEIVREAYEAFNREDLDAVLALTDPKVEIVDPGRTGKTFRGHDGYLSFIAEWLESWEEYRVEIQDLTQSGDRVLVDLVQTGRGQGSGIEFSEPLTQVVTVRKGKIARLEIYIDRADAMRAAGLSD